MEKKKEKKKKERKKRENGSFPKETSSFGVLSLERGAFCAGRRRRRHTSLVSRRVVRSVADPIKDRQRM